MNTAMLHTLAQTTTKPAMPSIAPEAGTFWMPSEASTTAAGVDAVFYFIFWISAFFFALIVTLTVVFVIRYRRRYEGQPASSKVTHNTALELTWTIIPLILVIIMFAMAFYSFMDMAHPPSGALDIHVLGQKWTWAFTYPNGHVDSELHVPVDTPVRLILSSNDVIHSFFVPAFRIKKDAVPGRYNKIWFEATKPGDYLALCAEYCGTQHSDMVSPVIVHEPGQYEVWLEAASDPFKTRTLPQVGALLVTKRCGGCHTVDGSAGIGPTFQNVYGHTVKLTDGTSIEADENYIRESIVNPQRQIVAGFEPVMPTFKGQLKDKEILAIIEYLKELSDANH